MIKLYKEYIKPEHVRITEEEEIQKKITQHGVSNISKESNYYCNDCKLYSIIVYDSTLVCTECATENDSLVNTNAEWHNYSSDGSSVGNTTRCGNAQNPLLYSSYYGTSISNSYKNNVTYGKLLQTIQWNSLSYPDKSKKEVFQKLSSVGKENNLTTNIIEYSQQLFSEITDIKNKLEEKSSRGDFLEGLIAACTGKACEAFGIPVFPKDLAKMYKINQTDVTRGMNKFDKLILNSENEMFKSKNLDNMYLNYVDSYCEKLKINAKSKEIIKEYLQKIHDKNLLPKNTPQAIISGCIYFVSIMLKLNIKKEHITETCSTSLVTINKIYNILINYTSELI